MDIAAGQNSYYRGILVLHLSRGKDSGGVKRRVDCSIKIDPKNALSVVLTDSHRPHEHQPSITDHCSISRKKSKRRWRAKALIRAALRREQSKALLQHC